MGHFQANCAFSFGRSIGDLATVFLSRKLTDKNRTREGEKLGWDELRDNSGCMERN